MPDRHAAADTAAAPDAGDDTLRERIPTTVQVRHKYATVLDDTQGWRYSEEWGTDFDRWLAEHIAAAVQAERKRLARDLEARAPSPSDAYIERVRALTVDAVERSGYDDLVHVSDIRAVLEGRCCGLHNKNCEPPSELCCAGCTEHSHPKHPEGVTCVLEATS